jgi:phenol hydroxylase P4 protein
MAVKAISEYTAEPKDKVENFNGMQLLYIRWHKHLMFCAPFALLVSPNMTFPELWETQIKPAIAPHPDSAKIAVEQIQWELNGKAFEPNQGTSLLELGIDHKSMLTMATPGLNGLYNAGF